MYVSMHLWACTAEGLKVYFSTILCEVSQEYDKEQIWMGKELISALLQSTTQKAHSGLLPFIFWTLFLTWDTPSQSTEDNLGNLLGKSIWTTHSLETDDRKISEELFSPVKNMLELRFVREWNFHLLTF